MGFRRVFISITLVLMLAALSFIFFAVSVRDCFDYKTRTFQKLLESYNPSQFKFKGSQTRQMAIQIYNARLKTLKPAHDRFTALVYDGGATFPEGETLCDLALYQVLKAKDRSPIALHYIRMYNSPDYMRCLRAYHTGKKKFMSIDPSRSTADIIIKDVLGIGNGNPESSLSTVIRQHALAVNPKHSTSDLELVVGRIIQEEQLYNLMVNGYVE